MAKGRWEKSYKHWVYYGSDGSSFGQIEKEDSNGYTAYCDGCGNEWFSTLREAKEWVESSYGR